MTPLLDHLAALGIQGPPLLPTLFCQPVAIGGPGGLGLTFPVWPILVPAKEGIQVCYTRDEHFRDTYMERGFCGLDDSFRSRFDHNCPEQTAQVVHTVLEQQRDAGVDRGIHQTDLGQDWGGRDDQNQDFNSQDHSEQDHGEQDHGEQSQGEQDHGEQSQGEQDQREHGPREQVQPEQGGQGQPTQDQHDANEDHGHIFPPWRWFMAPMHAIRYIESFDCDIATLIKIMVYLAILRFIFDVKDRQDRLKKAKTGDPSLLAPLSATGTPSPSTTVPITGYSTPGLHRINLGVKEGPPKRNVGNNGSTRTPPASTGLRRRRSTHIRVVEPGSSYDQRRLHELLEADTTDDGMEPATPSSTASQGSSHWDDLVRDLQTGSRPSFIHYSRD